MQVQLATSKIWCWAFLVAVLAGGIVSTSAHSPSFTLTGYRPVPTVAEGADRKSARLATVIRSLIVHHSGTHGAYENVIRGNAELGLVARRPSPDELELAKGMGVQRPLRSGISNTERALCH